MMFNSKTIVSAMTAAAAACTNVVETDQLDLLEKKKFQPDQVIHVLF